MKAKTILEKLFKYLNAIVSLLYGKIMKEKHMRQQTFIPKNQKQGIQKQIMS